MQMLARLDLAEPDWMQSRGLDGTASNLAQPSLAASLTRIGLQASPAKPSPTHQLGLECIRAIVREERITTARKITMSAKLTAMTAMAVISITRDTNTNVRVRCFEI